MSAREVADDGPCAYRFSPNGATCGYWRNEHHARHAYVPPAAPEPDTAAPGSNNPTLQDLTGGQRRAIAPGSVPDGFATAPLDTSTSEAQSPLAAQIEALRLAMCGRLEEAELIAALGEPRKDEGPHE